MSFFAGAVFGIYLIGVVVLGTMILTYGDKSEWGMHDYAFSVFSILAWPAVFLFCFVVSLIERVLNVQLF